MKILLQNLALQLIIQSVLLLSGFTVKAQSESEKLNEFFEQNYMEQMNLFPEWQGYQGIKDRNDEWNDDSDEMWDKAYEMEVASLQYMKTNFDYDKLEEQAKVSYRLFEEDVKQEIASRKFRYHNFPVNQMFGEHTSIPSFLINIHSVDNVKDAEAYIKRLQKVNVKINQLVDGLKKRADMNIVAPAFVFPKVIEDCNNIIKGFPFEAKKADCTIMADFRKKVTALNLKKKEQKKLLKAAKKALLETVKPAYQNLLTCLTELQKKADGNKGAWCLPDGEAYYQMALNNTTTTTMTAEEIFETGQSEIERIHAEMKTIMEQTGFEGDLKAFFDFMEADEQFYFSDNDNGRAKYMERTNEIIDGITARLDDLFIVKPKAELEVKRVEPFREKSAGKAFYNRGAPDGSRPGTYYANLYDMSQMPWYQMEALAYHEAIPGHHMQISIAMELEGLPKFRKYGRYTAYVEGWGLYSEFVPKEIGFYEDPYSDFGRLAMELWRACRLVADVGIHNKQWTLEKAIALYADNTPNPYEDCVKMVERHFVMPSQATAYKIGMLKILELREKAKETLGDKFDIRAFHDVVLKNGALPLSILEEYVDTWVNTLMPKEEAE